MELSGLFGRKATTGKRVSTTYAADSLAKISGSLPASAQKSKAALSAQKSMIHDTLTISKEGRKLAASTEPKQDTETDLTTAQGTAEEAAAAAEPMEEELTEFEQYLQDKQDRLSNAVSFQEDMQNAKDQADAAKKEYENLGKCLEISRRIVKGDKVPNKDMKFLMEKQPKLYKMSIMLRKTNAHPKKHKALSKEEEETQESALTDDMKAQLQDLANRDSAETGSTDTGSAEAAVDTGSAEVAVEATVE